MRDRVTAKPRGFGFITFDSAEAARVACGDTHTLDGRVVGGGGACRMRGAVRGHEAAVHANQAPPGAI
jgi:hypothetical protein